jgi:hypothetical protein
MRIDFKDDLLAGLAKLHEHRAEAEEALADGRLQLWEEDTLLSDRWEAISLKSVVHVVLLFGEEFLTRDLSLIIKPGPDYMYNTRTAERVEVPDRFHEEPAEGEAYWLEGRGRGDISSKSTWGGRRREKQLLASGLLHKTRESAEIARKARFDYEY